MTIFVAPQDFVIRMLETPNGARVRAIKKNDKLCVESDNKLYVNDEYVGIPEPQEINMSTAFADQGCRFVTPDWEDVTFTVEGGVLAVHVPGFNPPMDEPDAEIGWLPHTVRFSLIDYTNADVLSSDEDDDVADEVLSRFDFYEDALTEFRQRLREKLPLDKPRERAPSDHGLDASTYLLYVAHGVPAGKGYIGGNQVNGTKPRLLGADFADSEARIVSMLAEDGKLTLDVEAHIADMLQKKMEQEERDAMYGAVADSYRKAYPGIARWWNAVKNEWSETPPDEDIVHQEGDKYVALAARQLGKSEAAKKAALANLTKMVADHPGPEIRLCMYGVQDMQPLGLRCGDMLHAENGRSAVVSQIEVKRAPIRERNVSFFDGVRDYSESTEITLAITKNPVDKCLKRFWYNTEPFKAYPHQVAAIESLLGKNQFEFAGSRTGRWSSAQAKRASLYAGYGGKGEVPAIGYTAQTPMTHEQYPTHKRYGGIEVSPGNLEYHLTLTCKYEGADMSLRTVLVALFAGVAHVLGGHAPERLIPESNRDGGYDPKKIDFSAITAGLVGSK